MLFPFDAVFCFAIRDPPLAAVSASPRARIAAECRPNGFAVEGSGEDIRIRLLALDARGRRVDPCTLGLLPRAELRPFGERFEVPTLDAYFDVPTSAERDASFQRVGELDEVDECDVRTATFMTSGVRYADEGLPDPLPLRGLLSRYRLVMLKGHRERHCPTRTLAAAAWWLGRRPAGGRETPTPVAMVVRRATLLRPLLDLFDRLPLAALSLEQCSCEQHAAAAALAFGERTATQLLELSVKTPQFNLGASLRVFRNLRSLSCYGRAFVSFASLEALVERCPGLRFLRIPHMGAAEERGMALDALPSVEVAAVAVEPRSAWVEWLAHSPGLKELHILTLPGREAEEWLPDGPERANDAAMAPVFRVDALGKLARLEKLSICSPFLRDVEALARCGQLQEVCLHGCPGLTSIDALGSGVAGFTIRLLDLSASGLTHLPPGMANDFRSLEVLNVHDTSIESVRPLAGSLLLTDLDITGTRVTDMAPLLACPRLRRLRTPCLSPPRPIAERENGQFADSLRDNVDGDLREGREGRDGAAEEDTVGTAATHHDEDGTRVLARFGALEVLDLTSTCVRKTTVFPATLTQLRLGEAAVESLVGLRPARASLRVFVAAFRAATPARTRLQGLDEVTSLEAFAATNLTELRDFACLRASAATLRSVSLLCPRHDGYPLHLRGLEACGRLERLEVRNATALDDLTPLTDLTGLREVILHTTSIATLDPLSASSQSLELVDVTGCAALTAVGNAFLCSRRLRHLYISGTRVRDVTTLKHCWSLEKVHLVDCHALTDVDEAFAGLRRLRTLLLDRSGVTAIRKLHSCPLLQYLGLRECGELVTVEGLAGCLSLDHLFVCSAPALETIGDAWRVGRLCALSVHGADSLTQVIGIEKEPRFISLVIVGAPRLVSVGNGTRGFRRLLAMWLNDCYDFKNLSVFINAERLGTVSLASTGVSDLRPLKACLKKSLRTLNLAECHSIVDFAPLRFGVHLQALSLCGTGIRDLRPLTSCVSLFALDLSHCKALPTLAPLARLPRLRHLHARHSSISHADGVWKHRRNTIYLQGSRSLDPEHVSKLKECVFQWGAFGDPQSADVGGASFAELWLPSYAPRRAT